MSVIRYVNGWDEPMEATRDEYHLDQEPLLTAYNTAEDGGVTDKIQIPLSRVVKIKEADQQ